MSGRLGGWSKTGVGNLQRHQTARRRFHKFPSLAKHGIRSALKTGELFSGHLPHWLLCVENWQIAVRASSIEWSMSECYNTGCLIIISTAHTRFLQCKSRLLLLMLLLLLWHRKTGSIFISILFSLRRLPSSSAR